MVSGTGELGDVDDDVELYIFSCPVVSVSEMILSLQKYLGRHKTLSSSTYRALQHDKVDT